MKHKKLNSVLALVLAAMMLLAACGTDSASSSSSNDSAGNASTEESSRESSDASSEEPVVLTVWLAQAEGYDYDTNVMTTTLEEKFNVDLQFETFTDDANTQYNLKLASGEYPDMWLGLWFSASQVTAGAEAGALLPLNDYIVDGTNFKAALDENDGWEKMLTANDGNIYTFMYTDSGVHKDSEYKMWIRTDWMENLGWENPPSTPEEFKQYLIDIRDNDVNGNGDPSDEIPLMGYYGGRKTDPICFLMNPFELYTDNYYYITDDSEIYFSAITDGWREGLAYIADLYAEGLIAEETYVQDQATFKSILNKADEEAVVGVFPCWAIVADVDTSVMNWFTYEALAPLDGNYQQSAARFGGNFNMVGAISSTCEHPEVAFAIYDYLIGEEGFLLGAAGIEGESYEMVDEEDFNGTSPSRKMLVGTDELKNYTWNSGQFPRWDSAAQRYNSVADESTFETDNTYVLVQTASVYEPYYVNHHIPDIVWADEATTTQFSEMSAMINDYIKTSDTEFIMGRKDINDDAQWQEYLDTLDSMGLQEYIEVLYTYYGLN